MKDELFETALKHYNNGEYQEALRLYYQILLEDFENYSSYYNIGLIYDVTGEIELAIAFYNKAIKLNKNDIRSMNNLARIYLDLNENQALELLDRIIQIEPLDAEAYNTYGNFYFKKKDYKQAKLYLQKSINFDKNYFKNYYDIAKAYIGLNDYKKAGEMLEKCLKLQPDFELAKELLLKL